MRSPFGILTDYQKQSLGKKSGNKKLGKKVWHFYSEFSMTALPGELFAGAFEFRCGWRAATTYTPKYTYC
jgi:hypothetical protein